MKKIFLIICSLILTCTLVPSSLASEASLFSSSEYLAQATSSKPKPRYASGRYHNPDDMTPSEKAVLYYSGNNIEQALETLQAIKDGNKTSQDYLLLGNLLQDQNKIHEAIFMYKRAMLVDENNYRAAYNLGNTYFDQGKYKLAIESYRKCNKINNKFPYAYYNLGCAYAQTGHLLKAKIAFLKAIELKNTEPDFHYNLALTYKKLGNKQLAAQYLEFYNNLTENN